jgi:hypothetical protein
MAKQKQEAVAETVEQPNLDSKVEKLKVKKKPSMRKLNKQDEVIKVNLDKPTTPKENEETKEDTTNDGGVVELVEESTSTQEQEEIQSETETQERPVIEEVTDEVEETVVKTEETITDSVNTEKELPENIQKLVDFMEETGGDLNDYVKLNQDYSELDNTNLLKEYYKQTKPHLDSEEIDFLMEDQFSYDEDIDDEKDIKRKKLALKEQVAEAKLRLDDAKSKYYKDIKAGSKLTSEQQKAIDFFNRYNKESQERTKVAERSNSIFTQKTNEVFNDKFKGFEYNIGDKKYRYNVNNSDDVRQNQSDVSNVLKKFLNNNNEMEDAKGYHKSMFTAMNADAVANHFYEQGKTDALKASVAKSKNIDMDPRQAHSGGFEAGGLKFKVLGDNSNDFKFKIKNKNN